MNRPARSIGRLEFTATRRYFGTLKIAIRLLPMLNVCRSVAENTRFFPFVVASRQPVPLVIFAPFGALIPLIVISPAMVNLPWIAIASNVPLELSV